VRSASPISLTLPPFSGVVRRIVLIAVVSFFAFTMLSLTPLRSHLAVWTLLVPTLLVRAPWTLLTYPFVPTGLLSTAFALISIWLFGAMVESARGERWMLEFYFITTAGGGLLAALLFLLLSFVHLAGFTAAAPTAGLWPFVLALLLAFARDNPEQQVNLMFVLNLKAKYMAAIYLLVYLALALIGGDRFGAATALCAAFCGFIYLRSVPRRGLAFAVSERWFALRNRFYRNKRKRAAKKFTVYMKQQGRDVRFDASGKYVALDDEKLDPTDKKWMN
jgi:membrane associated rhomboid family serine protease